MQFLCDEVQKYAVDNLNTAAGKQFADPASSETLIVSACRVIAIPSATTPRVWDPQEPDGGTFRAAIGLPAVPPIAGTYYIGFGVQTSGTLTVGKRYIILDYNPTDNFTGVGAASDATGVIFIASGTTPMTWSFGSILTEITTDLAYNATFSAVNTALNLLASITTAGGVAVTLNGASFLIAFNTVGSREQISADASNLAPTGTIAEVGTDLDGSASVREVQYLRFVQQPAAFVDLTDAAPGPGGTVDVLTVGGAGPPAVNATYRVTLFTSDLNQAYDGRWSITVLAQTSGLIPFDASGDATQTILEAMAAIGTGNVSVFRESPGVYLIGFQGAKAGTNTGTMTVDTSALKTVPYMTGELDLSNPAIQLLFGTASTVAALFVIEYTPSGGNRREICRRAITLEQALIADGSLTPTPRISFYTTAETYSKSEVDAFFAGLLLGTIASQDANNVNLTGGVTDGLSNTNGTYNGVNMLDTGSGFWVRTGAGTTGLTLGLLASVSFGAGGAYVFTGDFVYSGAGIVISGSGSLGIGPGGTLGTGAFAPIVPGANPTGTVGLAAVNGSATTYLRSDGAPALDVSIAPTWTGAHTFNNAVSIAGTLAISNTITFTPANKTATFSPTGTGSFIVNPATLGSMNNIAIGGSTPAGSQFSSTKVGPAATPGTTINRVKHGTATLVLGTVTVGEATVTTSSRIFLTVESLGTVTVPKSVSVTARVASASFTITSSDLTDTSVVGWLLIEP